MNELKLGVVGYCPPTKFDEVEARRMLNEAYCNVKLDFPNKIVTVVSGLTNVGVLKLAYEEAKNRGWRTAGIACEKARGFEWFPVDDTPIIIGKNWGEESETFINSIDALVRIGIGPQSIKEARLVKALGKKIYEYDLPKLD